MTNEERFIASCQSLGEANVRQKLNADGYGGQRAVWASSWLDQVESGKSDATKAEERNSLSRRTRPNRLFAPAVSVVLVVLLLGCVALFLKFS